MATAHLVVVDDPALVLLVPALVTSALFNKLIDGEMLETCVLGKELTEATFAYARRAGYDNVWKLLRHTQQPRRGINVPKWLLGFEYDA